MRVLTHSLALAIGGLIAAAVVGELNENARRAVATRLKAESESRREAEAGRLAAELRADMLRRLIIADFEGDGTRLAPQGLPLTGGDCEHVD